jgi:mRNA interferase HigB
MRIITKRTLDEFCKKYPDATVSLKFWFDTIKANDFYTSQEVVALFNSADPVGNNRIVFNIARNKYRLIAKFEFHPRLQRVYIRFIGTHAEYDKIKDISNI